PQPLVRMLTTSPEHRVNDTFHNDLTNWNPLPDQACQPQRSLQMPRIGSFRRTGSLRHQAVLLNIPLPGFVATLGRGQKRSSIIGAAPLALARGIRAGFYAFTLLSLGRWLLFLCVI